MICWPLHFLFAILIFFLIKALLSLGIRCFLGLLFGRTCLLQISRQMLIIVLFISHISCYLFYKLAPACAEQVSINTCPTDVFVEEVQNPVAQVAFLNLVVCFSSTIIFMFVSISIILWSLIYVSVMIIKFCRVSWSLLLRKTSSMLFFFVGSFIYILL